MPSDWNINVAGVQGQQGPSGGPAGVNGAGYLATSTTNAPIATGSVTVTTQAGLAYSIGARVRLSSHSAPSQWIEGLCTAYVGTSLTINVDLTSGMVPSFVYLVPILANYLGGLTLVNDATNPNTVLDIATGCATSDDGSTIMSLAASGFSKNCNAAWAVGSGNGALDSGTSLAASTWYHVFVIMRIDTNIVDVLISTSATAPTLPASYTKKRRVGSIKTDASSHITKFTQYGDFFWIPKITLLSGAAATVSPPALIGGTPSAVTQPILHVLTYTGTNALYNIQVTFWDPTATQVAQYDFEGGSPGVNGASGIQIIAPPTNSAGTFLYAVNLIVGAATLVIELLGWIDNRGK